MSDQTTPHRSSGLTWRCMLAALILSSISCNPFEPAFEPRRGLKPDAVLELLPLVDLQSEKPIVEIAIKSLEVAQDKTSQPTSQLLDEDGNVIGEWIELAQGRDEVGKLEKRYKFVPRDDHLVREGTSGTRIDMTLALSELDPLSDNPGADFYRWARQKGFKSIQVLCIKPGEGEKITGDEILQVVKGTDPTGRFSINFETTTIGAKKMGRLTTKNRGSDLGIVVEGELHSAPVVNEAIFNRGTIEGNFSEQEIDELILNLRSLAYERTE